MIDKGFSRDTNNGRDTRDLSLSPYQQQFFLGWVRAKEAVPPPSQSPNGRAGIEPLMSSTRPLDLVQDAASDCSVVTSLCAGVARSERGHEQVCYAESQQLQY
jgi:calpain-7